MFMVRPRLRRSKGAKAPNSSLPGIWVGQLWKTGANTPLSPHRLSLPRYNGRVPFAIRNYEPADFETLWRVDQECFPPGISYSRAELKFYMRRPGSFTLVAVEAAQSATADPDSRTARKNSPPIPLPNAVAGFLVAEADRESGHIITIDVLAAARRSGVGSLLLRGAEDRLRAAQCRSVELETAVDNLSALSFYKRHGYSVIKTFPRYYSNGVDALMLEKDLS
jgi:ribosomal-protein-alanine N-acetyltransferase